MGRTYEKNMADTALVVKSLKVLEKIDGGGIKEIKDTVESVKRQTTAQSKQQEEYWKTLSDDGVITVIEKQTLYRETQNIARSYAAVTQQAQSLGMPSSLVADYIATYNVLHTYLYSTLKIFDDMSVETRIDNRDTFNAYFSNYYFSENFVLIAITSGILDNINFRVLQSLTEPGTEGETAIYHGGLYQYINGQWKSVSTGAYKGPRNELPADEEKAFFIVSESFILTEGLIVNGEELYVNGDLLGITHIYLKGQIYYFQDGIWLAEHDRTNWLYAAAFADVINITGELPKIFQDAIDDLQEQIDTKASVKSLQEEIAERQGQYTIINGDIVQINSDIFEIIERADGVDDTLSTQAAELRTQAAELRTQAAELESQGEDVSSLLTRADALEKQAQRMEQEISKKISHLPVYFGGRNSVPQNPQEGDFFVWTGATYGGWENSKIYKYTSGKWIVLAHTETANRSYYMMALEDILATNNAGEGYFSAVFASSFFGNAATINSLATKTIYLRQNGYIQSDKTTYVVAKNGLKIDGDGNIDANGDTHIAGKVAIGVDLKNAQNQYMPDFTNYDVVIGGRALFKAGTKIQGTLDGATGSFSGALSGATGSFSGVLSGANGNFSGDIINNVIEARNETPAGKQITIVKGTKCLEQFSNGIGSYNEKTFTASQLKTKEFPGGILTILDGVDMYGRPIFKEIYVPPSVMIHLELLNNNDVIESIPNGYLQYDLTYTYNTSPSFKTLKLKGIPTFQLAESGVVYKDENGFLRIS